jgi:hypothetical protein
MLQKKIVEDCIGLSYPWAEIAAPRAHCYGKSRMGVLFYLTNDSCLIDFPILEGRISMIEKKTGLLTILFLSALLLCFGTIATAETYNYAGSDGDWQGQLTLTVNSDGSVLLNGASMVGGTIESIPPDSGTYGDFSGHYVSQELGLTGSQGYAGTGVVDGNGNSAGTQVSFTNGENVMVDQRAFVYTSLVPPEVPSGSPGPYGPPLQEFHASARQEIEIGGDKIFGPLEPGSGSYFETLSASTSAHNADGSGAGVGAQAVATDDGNATVLIRQLADTRAVGPASLYGSYGTVLSGSTTFANQAVEIENISSAAVQAYATNPQVSTMGSLFVTDGNLSLKETARTRQGNNFAALEYGASSNPNNLASLDAGGRIEGKSGGSSVISTFSNGDSATVTSAFLITNGSRTDYPVLNFDLIGLAASNSSADLVWARTNITNNLFTAPVVDPVYDYTRFCISTASHNTMGDSQILIVETGLKTPLEYIGQGTGIFRTADITRHWQNQWVRIS